MSGRRRQTAAHLLGLVTIPTVVTVTVVVTYTRGPVWGLLVGLGMIGVVYLLVGLLTW